MVPCTHKWQSMLSVVRFLQQQQQQPQQQPCLQVNTRLEICGRTL
jgi:sucrose-6-phosphate hydrolase SacC (GH32 family)